MHIEDIWRYKIENIFNNCLCLARFGYGGEACLLRAAALFWLAARCLPLATEALPAWTPLLNISLDYQQRTKRRTSRENCLHERNKERIYHAVGKRERNEKQARRRAVTSREDVRRRREYASGATPPTRPTYVHIPILFDICLHYRYSHIGILKEKKTFWIKKQNKIIHFDIVIVIGIVTVHLILLENNLLLTFVWVSSFLVGFFVWK